MSVASRPGALFSRVFCTRAPSMLRLLLWLVLGLCLMNSGCAALGTAAGLYALSQTDFVQDEILD